MSLSTEVLILFRGVHSVKADFFSPAVMHDANCVPVSDSHHFAGPSETRPAHQNGENDSPEGGSSHSGLRHKSNPQASDKLTQ